MDAAAGIILIERRRSDSLQGLYATSVTDRPPTPALPIRPDKYWTENPE